ncbi:ABC transporter ATP-binding protein [Fundicoccus culcitae]|uniref:ABC transporter ATP-binding protein/permease n=1 Tax=Fundicoccus culcitae TaxID=2969821 RepID=A0ABY5P671_9LACT|nr:ABC transporter ATP-binding protein [Fundicoccus culcitae]UUX34241.1 ABC transporter ATP-binding protein/permease [Fundicoccus culcitae]
MLRIWKLMDKKNLIKIFLLILFEATMFMLLPTLASDILNYSVVDGNPQTVWLIGIIMLILNVLALVLAFISVKMSAKESQGLGHKLRMDMFERIMAFSQEDMAKFGTSTLITRTTNDVMQIQLVTQMIIRLIILSPVIMIVSVFFAYQRESQLAWVFAITLPLILIVVGIILYFASPIFRSIQKKTDRLNKVFREGLTGIRVIRAFNTTEYEEQRFDDANIDFRNASIKANSIMAFMLPGMLLVMAVSNSLIFLNGANLISVGEMEVGNLIAFVQYGVQILNSVLQVAFLLFFLPRAQVSAERILEVIDTEPSIEDLTKEVDVLDDKEVTLAFEHVDFGFPGAERPAIEDINFSASKGETIAIIGGTGSGKTTIANLIPRLYEASKGKVRVNGVNVKNVRQEELRSKIGFAPQKALLFSGTIRSNMQYGKNDATDAEIWKALEIAQADFVKELDDLLDAKVDQGGVNFSGGQRQRLSIARTIISQPDIFVFDDTFSALDFKTDANLRKALKPITRDAITIIIAQRVNTVIDADRILVLENGKIVGEGTHQSLLAENAVYQDIVASQMKGENR